MLGHMTIALTQRQATFTNPELTPSHPIGKSSLRFLLDASHGGAYSVIELRLAPGFAGPPMLHHHTHEEASFVVLEGRLEITTGERSRQLGPGDLAHLPPGIDFVWKNASLELPARCLCIYAPAGFEQMMLDISRAFAERPLTPDGAREVMPGIWRKYGVEMARGR